MEAMFRCLASDAMFSTGSKENVFSELSLGLGFTRAGCGLV